jgi:cytochrome c oxidase cbb3-type subunit 2
MTSLRQFVFFLFLAFFVPWCFLIAVPSAKLAGIKPQLLDENDPAAGVYPPARSNVYKDGEIVYARQGCANCHTQMIRPTYLGIDSFKRGWGRSEDLEHTRETRPEDFLGDHYAFLGIQRNGPDLANAGHRLTDPTWIHSHLYDPRQHNDWSNMPSYRHLYEERKIQGAPSDDALDLEGDMAPSPGFEIVPTTDARVLVDYLMTLKRDSEVPPTPEQIKAAKTAKEETSA